MIREKIQFRKKSVHDLARMSSTEMAYEIKRLDVWSGDWGLPSIDHSCLAIQVMKFLYELIKKWNYIFIETDKGNSDQEIIFIIYFLNMCEIYLSS